MIILKSKFIPNIFNKMFAFVFFLNPSKIPGSYSILVSFLIFPVKPGSFSSVDIPYLPDKSSCFNNRVNTDWVPNSFIKIVNFISFSIIPYREFFPGFCYFSNLHLLRQTVDIHIYLRG